MNRQKDEQQIRALIETWGKASGSGDLIALKNLMTDDVVFLAAGTLPMGRENFAETFLAMTQEVSLNVHSNPQEITIAGDIAICWNLLEVKITPRAGGDVMRRAGNTITVFRRGDDGHWRIWRDANMLAPV